MISLILIKKFHFENLWTTYVQFLDLTHIGRTFLVPSTFKCYFCVYTYVNLIKMAIGAGVFFLYWFYVLVLNGGYHLGGGYGGQMGLLWELLLDSCPR